LKSNNFRQGIKRDFVAQATFYDVIQRFTWRSGQTPAGIYKNNFNIKTTLVWLMVYISHPSKTP